MEYKVTKTCLRVQTVCVVSAELVICPYAGTSSASAGKMLLSSALKSEERSSEPASVGSGAGRGFSSVYSAPDSLLQYISKVEGLTVPAAVINRS